MRIVGQMIILGQFNIEARSLNNIKKLNAEIYKKDNHYDQVVFILVMQR